MALSTAELKYVAACFASCEAVWIRKLLSNLFDLQLDDTCIYCDNHSCVNFYENRCSMTTRSISISNITISGIWCREEQ